MKKTKLVTSVVLAATLVGSSMTAFATGSVDYDYSGSNHIQSGSEANGASWGTGNVVAVRSDRLFLVALPNTADAISFTVDPSNKVYSPETVNFQNSEQKWNGVAITDVDDATSTDYRSAKSNWIMAYNAGSIPVNLVVDLNVRVVKDGQTFINPPQLDLYVEKSATNYSNQPLVAAVAPTAAEKAAHKYTIPIAAPAANMVWKTVQKGQDYFADVVMTDAEMAIAHPAADPVHEFNAEERDARFPYYTMGAFRLAGSATDSNWWTGVTTVDLNLKWVIRNTLDQNPWVEANWTVEDIQEGTQVPVFLGNGDSAATRVTAVKWDGLNWETGTSNNVPQNLLGTYCKFVRKNTTETYIEFTEEGLSNLAAMPSYLPANLTVEFDNGRPVTFTLWIK